MRIAFDNRPLIEALAREPSAMLRAAVMQREQYTCCYCEVRPATEIDHVKPWAQGGLTLISNLAAACRQCNREKGDRTPAEWRAAKVLAQAATLGWRPPTAAAPIADRRAPTFAELARFAASAGSTRR